MERITGKIKRFVSKWLNHRAQRIEASTTIQNINYLSIHQPKALICYVTHGFKTNIDLFNGGTQPHELSRIIRSLTDFGYCVDIANCHESRIAQHLSKKKYQVIIGFGRLFFKIKELLPNATSILYMTENTPHTSLIAESERVRYFKERHNRSVNLTRSGYHYAISDFSQPCNHIISMSDLEPLQSFHPHPYGIFPTGKFNEYFQQGHRNLDTAKKEFLWLGSSGAIHKGLDLLLDAFNCAPDLTLHIGGLNPKEKKILKNLFPANAIDHGYINIYSESFLEIANKCAFIILPSCSEACATSITTGMLHGLIPIVLKNTGFNRLENNAIFIDSFKIESLLEDITKISQASNSELNQLSEKIYTFSHTKFTPDAFELRINQIFSEVLK